MRHFAARDCRPVWRQTGHGGGESRLFVLPAMFWDAASLQRILPGPEIEDGVLEDHFDDVLDLGVWTPVDGSTGTETPSLQTAR